MVNLQGETALLLVLVWMYSIPTIRSLEVLPECLIVPSFRTVCGETLNVSHAYPQILDTGGPIDNGDIDTIKTFSKLTSPPVPDTCLDIVVHLLCVVSTPPCNPDTGLPVLICEKDCTLFKQIEEAGFCSVIQEREASLGMVTSFLGFQAISIAYSEFDCADPETYLFINVTHSDPHHCISLFSPETEQIFLSDLCEAGIGPNCRVPTTSNLIENEGESNVLQKAVLPPVMLVLLAATITLLLLLTCYLQHRRKKKSENFEQAKEEIRMGSYPYLAEDAIRGVEEQETEGGVKEQDVGEGVGLVGGVREQDVGGGVSLVGGGVGLVGGDREQDGVGGVREQDAGGGVGLVGGVREQDGVGGVREQDAVIEQYRNTFSKITIPYSDVIIDTMIGQGSFSKVFEGHWHSIDDSRATKVAVKMIKRSELKSFLVESTVMRDFSHPNVLGLVGVVFDTPDGTPHLVLPFMENGNLKNFLKSKRESSSKANALPKDLYISDLVRMCLDVARGMEYLAERKFVHRDLAARNCMLDKDLQVKVGDFGLSRDIYTTDYYRISDKSAKLPVKWMPPETFNDGISNEKTDIWAFGVMCWEVFSLGRTPYPTVPNSEMFTFISEGGRLEIPACCPNEMFDILVKCWKLRPEERPNFTNLVSSLSEYWEDSHN